MKLLNLHSSRIACLFVCSSLPLFYIYSGTSIIQPSMGQVLLAALMRWPEYNANSMKRFAHFWHKMDVLYKNYKCAIINTLLLMQTAWKLTTKSKWAVYPGANRYTRTRFLNRGIGSCQTSTIYTVCEGEMASQEGNNGRVWIGGDSFQGSFPHLSRGYVCGCKTLPRHARLTVQHYHL